MTIAKRHSDNMPIPYVKPSITELDTRKNLSLRVEMWFTGVMEEQP